MDLILLNDGLYSLVSVTKEMMQGIEIMAEVDCFDLCDIVSVCILQHIYDAPITMYHVMNDGSG